MRSFQYEVYVDTYRTGSSRAADMELILSTNDYDRAIKTTNFWDERMNVVLVDTRLTDDRVSFEERLARQADRMARAANERVRAGVENMTVPNIWLALNRINLARYELFLLKDGPKYYHAWTLSDLDMALEEG